MGSSSSELHQDTMKAFVSSLLVATALAAPADVGYVPAPAYAPAPAPYHPAPAYAPAPYHPEKVPPKPFAYEYGGADEYGRHFAKTETQLSSVLSRENTELSCPMAEFRLCPTTLTMRMDSLLM